jgi:DNA replication protein DnaC
MCLTKDGATYRRLPDIFREVRADFKSEQEIIDTYGTVKLLIIDEVGRQKFSDFEKNLFFEIIDRRWNNVLPTTLVTNFSEKEFFAEYGTAILDRLRPVIVRFTWESRRETLNIPEPPPEKSGDGF